VKASGDYSAIRDFEAYCAATSYHACNEYYRRAYPRRSRLRNQLRYLIGKQPYLKLWQSAHGEWLCGRTNSKTALVAGGLRGGWGSTQASLRIIEEVLDEANQPVPFDDLVDQAARRLQISDEDSSSEDLAYPGVSIETELERRSWLEGLWREIGELPLPQRLALLLNLRDQHGGPALALLPVIGIASIRDIAARLEMPAGQLAALWNQLPIDDLRVAQMLNVSRQQVINLRKAARERLGRRMGAESKKGLGTDPLAY
ncbi:MAG: hypothetical protein M3Y27_00405, partial [Acidobacteriota bacterium]|nr:hypothetical protein [Acidobacteriota bacterium]